ncbi:MAG: hypothetical protein HY370_06275 [Proteobacteria bacterium]|nr:hypothetical protein [Pseudomonadota bacterium]
MKMQNLLKETAKMAFVSDYEKRRTFDSVRGIEFRYKYGDRDGYENYELHWDNHPINIGVTKLLEKNGDHKQRVVWNIQKVSIPKNFSHTKEDVLCAIADAFEAYGLFHDRSRVESVKVNFSLSL